MIFDSAGMTIYNAKNSKLFTDVIEWCNDNSISVELTKLWNEFGWIDHPLEFENEDIFNLFRLIFSQRLRFLQINANI